MILQGIQPQSSLTIRDHGEAMAEALAMIGTPQEHDGSYALAMLVLLRFEGYQTAATMLKEWVVPNLTI